MRTLYLPVTRRWFEDIKAGIKPEEYREENAYWSKRLAGKTFDQVIVTLGYPSKTDASRRLVFPWNGYTLKTIQHPHFGDRHVDVFAVKLAPVTSSATEVKLRRPQRETELGLEVRCTACQEYWPADREFFHFSCGKPSSKCKACIQSSAARLAYNAKLRAIAAAEREAKS